MQAKTVSIIVPTFNRASFLPQSLHSALNQTRPPDEVIVVDDGSTDSTPDIAREFSGKVEYVRQENAGKSAALNRGISCSQGDHILILDDDDLLPETTIASHCNALQSDSRAGFSYGGFVRFSGEGEVAHLSDDYEEQPPDDGKRLLIHLMQRCFLPNPTWMVRRECQLEVGEYRSDLPRGQDYEMILRIARDWPGVFTQDVTLYQRKHLALRKTSKGTVKAHDTVQGWIDAEQEIFRRIENEWSDADFRPYDTLANEASDQRLAVLQRGVIMFMRKVYDRAEIHLDRYASMLGDKPPSIEEIGIARNMLGSRYGVEDLSDPGVKLDWLRDLRLPSTLRQAMASQLPWRMKELILAFRFDDARALLETGVKTFGAGAVFDAGLQRAASLVSSRRSSDPPSICKLAAAPAQL